ncbi:hypothetical protein AAMO2058_000927900 [Amorphochlora amoebiformis]
MVTFRPLATLALSISCLPASLSAPISSLTRSRGVENMVSRPNRMERRSLLTRASKKTLKSHFLDKTMALTSAAMAGPLLAAHDVMAATNVPAMERSKEIPTAAYPALGLFLLAFPGVWSQIKRAPKANIKRVTFEIPGPKAENSVDTVEMASKLFSYFVKYNYEVKDRGEVISFVGKYASDRGQAAFITAFTFFSFLSLGLVLSTLFPENGGNKWYLLSLLSPAAGAFVLKNGEREEEFKIKMVTSSDEMVTDIFTEGDIEEIERLQNELGLQQKGKVLVKGLFQDEASAPDTA